MSEWRAEITVFEKAGGPLTKRIALVDGKPVSDASSCRMANGFARRVRIDDMQGFADLINGFSPNEAYALGRIKDGLPDRVRVIRADKLNGVSDPAIIARTQDYLVFNKDEFGLALLDADFKGMSPDVTSRMEEVGGFWGALCEVLPPLETIACVERASTSSGLRDSKTGKEFSGSGGRHVVIPVLDAADIPRFLADLHARCWLNGFGWGMASAAGSFLERSIVDKSCGTPERLVFEGAPVIVPPLVQQGRNAVAHEGFILDTRLCAPLTDDENVELRKLLEAEESRLLPERQAARAAWELTHIQRLTAGGMSEADARVLVDRWIDRKELSSAFVLPFDDLGLAGTTVDRVLAEPEKFVGQTLSDPFEGPDYGVGKAIVYRRANGSMFINSFAHGGITYELKAAADEVKSLDEWDAGDDPGPIPPRQWLLANQFCCGFISSIVAAGAGGKSSVRILQFISLALGRSLCGQHVFRRCRVLLISLEDNSDELQRRIKAVLLHYGIERKELKGWLFCATPKFAKLAKMDGRNRIVGPLEQQLRAAISRRRPDIVSLDPFIKTHALVENDSSDMDFVCDLLAQFAIEFNVAVDSPHHAHKGIIAPGDADAGRGSSGIRDAGRLVYTLTYMSEDEARMFGIPIDERYSYVRLDSAQVNIAARGGKPSWFHLIGVQIDNATPQYPAGDTVQVVEPWSPPETWGGVSTPTLNEILNKIEAGLPDGNRYSDANSAKERAAWKVVQECAPEKSEAQCKEIIRTWVKNGVLVAQPYTNPKTRNEVTGLHVVDGKRPGSVSG